MKFVMDDKAMLGKGFVFTLYITVLGQFIMRSRAWSCYGEWM